MMSGAVSHPDHVILVVSADELSAEVTVAGQSHVVTGRDPKETRRAALAIATGYAARTGRTVLIDARDAYRSWRLTATPTGVVRAADAPGAPRPVRPRPRNGRKIALVAAGGAVAVALLAGAGFTVVQLLSGPAEVTAQEEAERIVFDSRPVPPGFTDQAAWRLPMAEGTSPAVAPDGSAAALFGPDDRLTVLGPDGTPAWSSDAPVPLDAIDQPLRFIADGDVFRIAFVADGALWIWPAEGGEPERVDLPDEATVTFAGTSPLIADGDRGLVVSGGRATPVELPEGMSALLADRDRVLAASVDGPWAWVAPGEDPREVSPAKPDGARELDAVVTASERHVIVRWTTADDARVLLAVHDAGDGAVVAAAEVAPDDLAEARWEESDDLAAYGPVLVEPSKGTARIVPGFTPLTSAGDTLYGEVDGAPVALGHDGEPVELEEDTARPWGLLDGHAVVAGAGALYALAPE
ncbi:hypothetical protein ACQEU5_03270 [Marinactinospora thermotolerans]|uniref:Uncharacterized protein n=1 Tax=Marinactinospora thermotolerans DSM 45154 TaxID=1122192 RepID=A0A1T4LFF1_9ACTN|nr:hypothetical protein [Marinactinospora thermotolerans]SJZ53403.1 hypothetical protein SAMN02745673_00653 [Marinactinospora thermotolerans DSM 45154]